MKLHTVLVSLFLVTYVSGQDNSTSSPVVNITISVTDLPLNSTENAAITTTQTQEDDYQYIVKLEYHFKEEKVPEFISEVITNGTEETPITISDLISLSKIQMFTLNYTLDLFQSLGLPPSTIFNIRFFENLLNILHVPFGTFYGALNDSLSLPPNVIMQVLRDLEIDAGQFSLAMITGEYNVYDVLRNGSFTAEALQRVVNSTRIPLDEIFLAVKDVLLEDLKKLDKREFDSLLKENGVDKNVMMLLWNFFGVTMEDVYNVNSLRKLLNDIVFNLNKQTSIGIVTDRNTLLLHTNDYENCQVIRKNIRIFTRSFLNDNVSTEVGLFLQKVNRNMVELQLMNASPKFIGIGKSNSSKTIGNCTYITFVNDELVYQSVDVVRNFVDYLEIDNTNQTFYNPGSPLICKNKLYGMAGIKHLKTIDFDSFYNYHDIGGTTITVVPITKVPTESSPQNSGAIVKLNLYSSFVVLFMILLPYCILQ